MRTIEFKMERQGLVNKGDKVKIIEREGTSSYNLPPHQLQLYHCPGFSHVRLLRRPLPH